MGRSQYRTTPYAERETVEVFWLLSLNAQHRLIGNAPEAVTRGILNSSLVHFSHHGAQIHAVDTPGYADFVGQSMTALEAVDTAAIVVNECEPLLLTDFRAMLEDAAPSDGSYRHDDAAVRTVNLTPDERVNGHSHCRALLLAPSACLNVIDGCLQLGRWQRVLLAELDGPRERQVAVLILGEDQR